MANFSDQVNITANFKESTLKILDLQKFYKELSGKDVVSFSGRMRGNLNDFSLKKLNLSTKYGLLLNGDLFFKNAINTERGVVFNGNLNNLTATYKELKTLLPNLLGKT